MTRRLVTRANALMFGVLFAIVLLVGGLTWERLGAARDARQWSQHNYRVIGSLKDLGIALRDAETGQRGYVLTGRPDYLTPYGMARDRIGLLEGEIDKLTVAEADQQRRLHALLPTIQHKLEELAQTVQARRDAGFEAALRIVETDTGRNDMEAITSGFAAMLAAEQATLDRHLADMNRRAAWVRSLVVCGLAVTVLTLLWAARLLNQAWSRSYRAEAEQRLLALRLRTSLESLSQGIAVFGDDGRLSNSNDCLQALLQVPKALLREGTPYPALAEHTACDGGLALETEDQVRHGRHAPGEPIIYERVRADGHHLEIRRTPMPDGGFVLTITDMTKRAEAEGVLREAQKMQAIGQLTGGIAHDFNNLLQVILGNLEFVRSKLDDTAMQKRIERATWAAQRGSTLTGQLLAFARKQPLAPAPINLAETMPDVVPLLQRTLGEHIDVRYVESAGLWPAMADAAQLESVILNLALNARDAMPGGGRLTIELGNVVLDADYARRHAEVKSGDYAMLAVSDTGHGMAPEVLARVFEPFFTTKLDGKGTGLGLAMVFGFVKQSGGHVKIYSEPGEGTTVKIYLPRAAALPSPAAQRFASPIDLPRGTATVLVVEDEAAVREIASAILRDLGYRVLEAGDGAEALQVFGAHAAEIDLLLTDVVLPGKVRGRELSERITAIRPGTKVLYMSGYTENSIVHHGRLDDGVHLLSKPFKREQLARKVADVLGLAHAVDETVVALRARRA